MLDGDRVAQRAWYVRGTFSFAAAGAGRLVRRLNFRVCLPNNATPHRLGSQCNTTFCEYDRADRGKGTLGPLSSARCRDVGAFP